MADHYNSIPLKHFAATVADCMGISLGDGYAPTIKWVSEPLKERLGGNADRVVLYHADAVGLYMWQKYTDKFAPVYKHTSVAVPFVSTVKSVTPVAHASMYTGKDPEGHGIHTYVRPQLTCETLYDRLISEGKRIAIIAMDDSSFLHIFAGRQLDYFVTDRNPETIKQKALELIEKDEYDLISIHTFAYDSAAHAHGPESEKAINAMAAEAENFAVIAEALNRYKGKHRILLSYSPDHGQHLVEEKGKGLHGSTLIEDMNVLQFYGTI